MIKIKRWMAITGMIVLFISQGEYRFGDFLRQLLTRNVGPHENYFVSIPILFVMEIISGLLNMLDNLWQFLLSWEGVLLIGVVLTYLLFREYLNANIRSNGVNEK
jgi:hypothetical protein